MQLAFSSSLLFDSTSTFVNLIKIQFDSMPIAVPVKGIIKLIVSRTLILESED